MWRFFYLLFLSCIYLNVHGQTNSLDYYLERAAVASPLIHDLNNQRLISIDEQERLRKQYTRSRLEMNGNYLFVPIITRDNGNTSFQWDGTKATDYYGYDTGVTNGELKAGITWTKPLLGNASYQVVKQNESINRQKFLQLIQLEQHELKRAVTEQYLLCMSDIIGAEQTDTISQILQKQKTVIEKLARQALIKQTDIHLLDIEISNNNQTASAFRQSYWNHLLDLNLLCGIADTAHVELVPAQLQLYPSIEESHFLHSYKLDSLSITGNYKLYNNQYKPQLNLFVDGGLRTSQFSNCYQHFGASAGVTFSWLLSDEGQRKSKYRQMQYQLNTNDAYKTQKQIMILQKRNACYRQLKEQEIQLTNTKKQLSDYQSLLQNYQREIIAGQLSILDYITVLKGYILQKKEYDSLLINRELIINALNYWNW